MVKKIINWTAGGFFRSLGRILLFVAIGFIISLFMSRNNISIPNLLGFDVVNAATITPTSDQWLTQWCSDRTCDYTLAGSTYNTGFVDRNVSYSNTNDYYLTTLRIRQQFTSPNLQSGVAYSFRYKVNFNPKYWSLYNANSNWDYELSVTNTSNATSSITGVCTFGNYTNDNYAIYIQCNYTPSVNLKQVAIIIRFPFTIYTSAQNFSGYLYKSIDSINYKAYNISYATSTIDAIDQQTTIIREQTTIINDSINNLNDTIQDDNVNSDTNDMGDFLNDYEFSNDGLISSLINAPITFLSNVLTNDSTNDFCRTFRGKNICIPNGKIVWNRTISCNENIMLCDSNYSVNEFKTYFSLVVGGYLFFKMLRTFVTTSEKAIDPNENKVEVMNL